MLRAMPVSPETVLTFWFGPPGAPPLTNAARWFERDDAFDAEIAARFAETLRRAAAGELEAWRETPTGALALVIVLDQFSRNLHRDSPLAFANDPAARDVAKDVRARRFDRALAPLERSFLYLPYEHAEDLALQEESVVLFTELAASAPPELAESLRSSLDYAQRHRDVIARFGRFPHRNAVLGRASTPAELEFLKEPGSRF
jgi:uncharacterized protein (DUF924 family)